MVNDTNSGMPQHGFGKRLLSERNRIGINAAKAAEIAGVSLPTYYAFEKDPSWSEYPAGPPAGGKSSNKNMPSLDALQSLAKYGFNVPFIMFGEHMVPASGAVHAIPSIDHLDADAVARVTKAVAKFRKDNPGNSHNVLFCEELIIAGIKALENPSTVTHIVFSDSRDSV